MRRLAPMLLVLLVAGCGRDFSLPQAPAAASTEPRFLGPLAGVYDLKQVLPVTVAGKTAPASLATGANLEIQDLALPNGKPDPVVGLIQSDIMSLGGAGFDPAAVVIRGSYGSRKLTAVHVFDKTHAAGIVGKPIPGGGGLTLAYGVCPGSTLKPVTLEARRVCSYEPQLSGIYVGHGGSCGDPASGPPRAFGFGVHSLTDSGEMATVVGLDYPDVASAYGGLYDRFGACGWMRHVDLDTGAVTASVFRIADDGKNLTLTLERGTGPVKGVTHPCQVKLSRCDSAFVGERKVGSAAATCQPAIAPGLSLTSAVALGTGGHRDLDVLVVDGGRGPVTGDSHLFPGATDDRSRLEVTLAAADGTQTLTSKPAQTPKALSAQFQLPARRLDPGTWRLTAKLKASAAPDAPPVLVAIPVCVIEPSP